MSPSFIRFGRAGENYKGVLKWARGIIETLRTTVPGGDLLDLDLSNVPKISSVFPEDGTRNIVEDVLDHYAGAHGPIKYLGEFFDWKDINHSVQKNLLDALCNHYGKWRRGNGGSSRSATSGDGFKWAESTLNNIYDQIDRKIEGFLEGVDFVALKKKDLKETGKITQAITVAASDIAEDVKIECSTICDDNEMWDVDDVNEFVSEHLDMIDDEIMYLIAARVREIIPDWKEQNMIVSSPGHIEDQVRDRLITFYDRIFHTALKGHPGVVRLSDGNQTR